MASSSAPGCATHTPWPMVRSCTQTLAGPAHPLRARLRSLAWRLETAIGRPAGLERAPTQGAAPRLDLLPWWAWIWYHLPFIDRYAHAWMWRHGAWEVRPPDTELGHIGGTD
jgi:hypothetical protein